MSTSFPTDASLGVDASIGLVATGARTEITSAIRTNGYAEGDVYPAQHLNYKWYVVSQWLAALEGVVANITTSDNVLLRAPATEGGDLTLRGGTTDGTADQSGGDLILESGESTGTGSSDVNLKASTAGTTGTTARTPETYILCDGANERVQIEKIMNAENATDTGASDGDFWTRDGFPRVWRNSALWRIPSVFTDANQTLSSVTTSAVASTVVTIPADEIGVDTRVKVHASFRVSAVNSGSGDLTVGFRFDDGSTNIPLTYTLTGATVGSEVIVTADLVAGTSGGTTTFRGSEVYMAGATLSSGFMEDSVDNSISFDIELYGIATSTLDADVLVRGIVVEICK